jgi:hypothetical protein
LRATIDLIDRSDDIAFDRNALVQTCEFIAMKKLKSQITSSYQFDRFKLHMLDCCTAVKEIQAFVAVAINLTMRVAKDYSPYQSGQVWVLAMNPAG